MVVGAMLSCSEGTRFPTAMKTRTTRAKDGMARPTFATETARNSPRRLCPTSIPTGMAMRAAATIEMADSSTWYVSCEPMPACRFTSCQFDLVKIQWTASTNWFIRSLSSREGRVSPSAGSTG